MGCEQYFILTLILGCHKHSIWYTDLICQKIQTRSELESEQSDDFSGRFFFFFLDYVKHLFEVPQCFQAFLRGSKS